VAKILIGLLALAIVLIGGSIISEIIANIPQHGSIIFLGIGLSIAAIVDIIVIIVYMLTGKY
jgi:hypothetical protein